MNAAKNLLKIGGIALATFLVVAAGAYFALPAVAPGLVSGSEAGGSAAGDSSVAVGQATADSAAATDSVAVDPSTQGSEEKGRVETAKRSSGGATSAPPSEQGAGGPSPSQDANPDSTGASERRTGITESRSIIEALRDSVKALRERLETVKKETAAVRQEAETLRGEVAQAKDRRLKASELSSALLDMQRRELTALLKKVNMNVLRQLYQRASGRSRTRLLQSMSPERAARFVNQVVEGEVADPSSEEPVASQ